MSDTTPDRPQDPSKDPWCVIRDDTTQDLGATESIFALANGHLGLRGNLDEGEPRALTGTYLNGFFESFPLEYGETGYGFAETGQTVINVPDGKIIRLLVENEPVDIERGKVESSRRWIDMRDGILYREMTWRSSYGHRIRLRSRRMVSFVQRSVAAIQFEVEVLDRPLRVALQSSLVAGGDQGAAGTDPRVGRQLGNVYRSRLALGKELRAVLGHTTRRTKLAVASGMDHVLDIEGRFRTRFEVEDNNARLILSDRIKPGRTLKLTKFLAYHWSGRQTVEWLRDQVDASLENAMAEGWDGLARLQREFLDGWWDSADIELEGDDELQKALRFALFHMVQASARVEGRAIAAKGLTGSGYDGHAFWDSETYVLPVLTYCSPQVVRSALEWRHSILPLARERAMQLGLGGAALPWRTIRGEDCSGYWPAALAAMHVNADVADAVRRYVRATGDEQFARKEGLELLVESARLWISLGHTDEEVGRFRIAGVTGPDEYSAVVDDNVFTNLMAQSNLRTAALWADRYRRHAKDLGVNDEEIVAWRNAADAMFIPYDSLRELHPQDAGFLHHEPWDFENTPAEEYPLLLHHPYFELYRRQVVKQADLVLALWLRGDAFTDEQKRRDFEYYEGLTVRDSSLSACVQSIVASEVGHVELAWTYLREAAFTDLDDLHSNATNGLHMASLGGAILACTNGFGGFRDTDDAWVFRPRLPKAISKLRFRLLIRGQRLVVELADGKARYRVIDGEDPMEIVHWGQTVTVDGEGVECDLPETPDLEAPGYPAGRAPGS